MTTEFKLPELGENIKTIQVVKLLVGVGDVLRVDQPVLELETDKATVEVPSSVDGTITAIHVKAGDEITVGHAILSVSGAASEPAAAPAPAPHLDPNPNPNPNPPVPVPTPVAAPAPAPAPAPARAAVATTGQYLLPELGESIKTIQVVKVLVKAGESVAVDQPIVELETDKATVELPSGVSGLVQEVHVKVGDEIAVGRPLFTYTGGVAATPPVKAAPAAAPVSAPAAKPTPAPRETHPIKPEIPPPAPRAIVSGKRVPAAPSVRRFAREIGIDVNQVAGTGPAGRVSSDDVKRHAKALNEARAAAPAVAVPVVASGGFAEEPLPDFSKFGAVEREKMSVIRRRTAEHLARSWALVPHVTLFDTADITELEDLRKRYAERAEKAGGKLTMAVMVVKVVAQALKVFPRFNASIDMTTREIVLKKFYNIGVAVDTERGLMVPVIRDADRKNMIQIAADLSQIAEKSRTGKITVADLEGGTFTISNLGRACGTFFTPIVNLPEVAILGVGRAFEETDAKTGKLRRKLPLSLSFDHRLIDGADGVRFLGWIIEALGEPLVLSLEG